MMLTSENASVSHWSVNATGDAPSKLSEKHDVHCPLRHHQGLGGLVNVLKPYRTSRAGTLPRHFRQRDRRSDKEHSGMVTLRRAELFGHGCHGGIVIFAGHLSGIAVAAHALMPEHTRSDIFVLLIFLGASEG